MPETISKEGRLIARSALWAETRAARMRGLLGHKPLGAGEALVIVGATQVHSFGMSYPIDVVFCDSSGVVLHVIRRLRPGRVTKWVRGAHAAVELPAHAAEGLAVGDRLEIRRARRRNRS